jgi:uncharacterized protein YbjQ (UPF0145 family)
MKKIVWVTRVSSRNYISDFGASFKNIIGGRLKTYEKMIDEGIKEATEELISKYPDAEDIKFQINEFSNQAISIIVYGRAEC